MGPLEGIVLLCIAKKHGIPFKPITEDTLTELMNCIMDTLDYIGTQEMMDASLIPILELGMDESSIRWVIDQLSDEGMLDTRYDLQGREETRISMEGWNDLLYMYDDDDFHQFFLEKFRETYLLAKDVIAGIIPRGDDTVHTQGNARDAGAGIAVTSTRDESQQKDDLPEEE
ncbi:hypothetical protein GF325_03155 [Candidatus Bathyarchaeota archaeon]|nr:hypothetical protein [Candidatus Bathyarchaeota archaeon]